MIEAARKRVTWLVWRILIPAVCVAVPFVAGAQVARGVVDGIVTDSNLVSISNATVRVFGSSLRVVTGPNGRFRIFGLEPGDYILLFQRLGYVGASTPVHVAAADTLRLSIILAPAAASLDTVSVTAPVGSARLSEFDERRRLRAGKFMTQVEIEKHNAVYVADLLLTFPEVIIIGGVALNRRDRPTKNCPFVFFIDGVAIPTPNVGASLPSPKEIAGIEVHTGPGTLPPQYNVMGTNCGVVLLWTRGGL